MSVQKIDRRSYVLHKELMEKVRADAELELKKQMRARSVKERAKLRSFLKTFSFSATSEKQRQTAVSTGNWSTSFRSTRQAGNSELRN
jgi:hypothetical protein